MTLERLGLLPNIAVACSLMADELAGRRVTWRVGAAGVLVGVAISAVTFGVVRTTSDGGAPSRRIDQVVETSTTATTIADSTTTSTSPPASVAAPAPASSPPSLDQRVSTLENRVGAIEQTTTTTTTPPSTTDTTETTVVETPSTCPDGSPMGGAGC